MILLTLFHKEGNQTKNIPFAPQEIEGLDKLPNLENLDQEDQVLVEVDKGQYSQSDVAQTDPLTMELQTPTKTDNVKKGHCKRQKIWMLMGNLQVRK